MVRCQIDCPACVLIAGPFEPVEAEQLAGVHDDLLHDGVPTAFVVAERSPSLPLADAA